MGVMHSLLWVSQNNPDIFLRRCCDLTVQSVGVPRVDIPGFWQFMYRISPGTYLVGGIMAAATANSEVACATNEVLQMLAPGGMSCGDFIGPFANFTGGRVLNPKARDLCNYCPIATSNDFLARFEIYYGNRWRDFGLLWVYIVVNLLGALGLYWLVRVPKRKGVKRT
jgi:ATP-binding cassette, subfamily G (WHITE), member 2, PDR